VLVTIAPLVNCYSNSPTDFPLPLLDEMHDISSSEPFVALLWKYLFP